MPAHPNRRQIKLLLWPDGREKVERAAARVGETLQTFIESAALERAQRILQQEAAMTITDETIEALRVEAGQAGDTEQIAICDRALAGDVEAREECARVIAEAQAARPAGTSRKRG